MSSCGSCNQGSINNGCGNGYLIVLVIYILLAIILGSCFFY